MASTDGASSAVTRGRSSRARAQRARARLALRAAELELCLSLVRALLARRSITIDPVRRFVLAAIEASSSAIVRKMLGDARRAIEGAGELEARVLAATARAMIAVESAAARYHAARRALDARSQGERWSVESAIDAASAALTVAWTEPTPTPTGERLWGATRPGVHKIAPSEELKSGTRWTAPIAAGDIDG
jgi:hypothetical protein